MFLTLEQAWQHRAAVLSGALALTIFGYLQRGVKISSLEATIAARPQINETAKTSDVKDVKKGPVKITRKTTVAPDGTKTTEQTREIGAQESHEEAKAETTHEEKPACPAPDKPNRWYLGAGVDPFHVTDVTRARVRGGWTFGDRLDFGPALDFSRPIFDGGLGVDATLRFK